MPTPKTIFITIDWFLPAYKAGGPVQSIDNMLEVFEHDYLRFRIFCSDTDLNGEPLTGIERDTWVDYYRNTKVWYASAKSRKIGALKKIYRQTNADVLFVNGIYSWWFSIAPLLFCSAKRKIVSVRGMLHPGALSVKSTKKKIFLQGYKLARLHKSCIFHASTDAEAGYIKSIFGPRCRVQVAENFPRSFSALAPGKATGTIILISVALISSMKNHLLVLQALQHCKSQVQYRIYGPVKDAAYWQQCLQLIQSLPPNIEVLYHGDISSSIMVAAALYNAHVFILPSKSENFGHAIYEAFTAGKPVITSNHTPWNNLFRSRAGINVDTASTAALTTAIDFFAEMDEGEFSIYVNGASAYAKANFDKAAVKNKYLQMFFAP
jgi:glycosyltransferase involved in cell wall biosynthesis